ncbi:hypothetical protein N9E24_07120 [Alphaproteobacteria bacterium]|nr:hypothetical protein [Alphaproteobacteria bacterium]
MITIIGQNGSQEFQAAERMASVFDSLWPGISTTAIHQDHIIIRAGAHLSGQRRKDIDLLIVGRLAEGRRFKPRKAIRDTNDRIVKDQPIYMRNFLAVGEVKAHSGDRLKAIGDEIFVKYRDKDWASATVQNDEQMQSMRNHLKLFNLNPYILRFVYLSSHTERLGSSINPTMEPGLILSSIVSTGTVWQNKLRFEYRSVPDSLISDLLSLPVFKEVIPTELDRKRLEYLSKKQVLTEQILGLGEGEILQLRGVGGTGKTVSMLSVASMAHNKNGERSLFLTYNRALASDLQRLMAILQIKSDGDGGGIKIDTTMSFFMKLARSTGLFDGEVALEPTLSEYEPMIELLLSAAQDDDPILDKCKTSFPLDFSFDRIFVDEAQDWQLGEASILKSLYSREPICVADGKQQLIRSQRRTDWFLGTNKEARKFENLNTCLRMKSNIFDFVSHLASQLQRDWDCERNDQVSGGRVVLIKEPYETSRDLHESLLESGQNSKIKNLDWLFLVPPDRVTEQSSPINKFLIDHGFDVLNWIDENSRDNFASNTDAFRVLQYESCRGLEGWNLVLDHFDAFLAMKLKVFAGEDFDPEREVLDYEDDVIEHLWNWLSMVLCRGMDTVVIHVNDARKPVGRFLIDRCRAMPDIAELYVQKP